MRSSDVRCRGRTIADAGGEDRALLRSNPSAHAGAETQAGGCQSDRPLSLLRPTAFSPQSDKPRGLGQSPKATPRTGGTYVNIGRLEIIRSTTDLSSCASQEPCPAASAPTTAQLSEHGISSAETTRISKTTVCGLRTQRPFHRSAGARPVPHDPAPLLMVEPPA